MALTKAKLEELIASGDIVIPGGGGGGSVGATFKLDIATGRLMVTTVDGYAGATFAINQTTGHLEVTTA